MHIRKLLLVLGAQPQRGSHVHLLQASLQPFLGTSTAGAWHVRAAWKVESSAAVFCVSSFAVGASHRSAPKASGDPALSRFMTRCRTKDTGTRLSVQP